MHNTLILHPIREANKLKQLSKSQKVKKTNKKTLNSSGDGQHYIATWYIFVSYKTLY